MSNESVSPLFSITPLVKKSKPPVVIVGLPRSGSSFLSNVLSQLDDWYVFDDLYAYQQVKSMKIKDDQYLTSAQIKQLLNKLGWSLRARIKHNNYSFQHDCTWDDVDKMEECAFQTFEGQDVLWDQVLEEWLTRIALHHDRHNWGYKTPQDFMHMDALHDLFPEIKFVFLVRNPRKVMSSFKNLPEEKGVDGTNRQYHPLAYALYWKMAYQKVTKFIKTKKAPVHIIQFEKLVANPDEQAQQLASFLDTKMSKAIEVKNKNTSFQGQKKRNLTATEVWICQLITGKYMQEMGYKIEENIRPQFKDLSEILNITSKFSVYQIERLSSYRSSLKQVSIVNYLKNLFA